MTVGTAEFRGRFCGLPSLSSSSGITAERRVSIWMLGLRCDRSRLPGGLLGFAGGGTLLECELDNAHHVFAGSRLAGPDFKLACRLMHERVATENHLYAAQSRQLDEFGLGRIVHHVKDVLRLDLVRIQRR